MAEELPWARLFDFNRRCPSRLHRVDSPTYYGRCELKRGHPGANHALERGMVVVRWAVFTRHD